jgi:hypothetical protein
MDLKRIWYHMSWRHWFVVGFLVLNIIVMFYEIGSVAPPRTGWSWFYQTLVAIGLMSFIWQGQPRRHYHPGISIIQLNDNVWEVTFDIDEDNMAVKVFEGTYEETIIAAIREVGLIYGDD